MNPLWSQTDIWSYSRIHVKRGFGHETLVITDRQLQCLQEMTFLPKLLMIVADSYNRPRPPDDAVSVTQSWNPRGKVPGCVRYTDSDSSSVWVLFPYGTAQDLQCPVVPYCRISAETVGLPCISRLMFYEYWECGHSTPYCFSPTV